MAARTNACLSINLSVNQKLAAEREVTGMPKYKASQVLLFLEVDDAATMDRGVFPPEGEARQGDLP
jgi:hypothetical protein